MIAIVLSRKDSGESDQIISFFTEEFGKVEALAKGVKKIVGKNSSFLETACLVDAEIIKGKAVNRVASVCLIDLFKNIRTDFTKLALCGYAVKSIEILTEQNERDKNIFNLLKSFLEFLDFEKSVYTSCLQAAFILKFFSMLGYEPELKRCVVCGIGLDAEKKNGFYASGGGVICVECAQEKINVGENFVFCEKKDVESLASILKTDWKLINGSELSKTAMECVKNFIGYRSERRIGSFEKFAELAKIS
ncbi:MAG: DNA repair protein RecO [Patescibacteria group bacterium]|nr:DNA repair protein RecO [Patescibacteria group bacterium]